MPVEPVKHQRQRLIRLAGEYLQESTDNFLLVRFKDGDEMWYALRDLVYIQAPYEVVGHARRV